MYAHTTSRTLPACDINLGPLTLLALEAGDFLELILLYLQITYRVTAHLLSKQTWLDGYSQMMHCKSRSLSVEWGNIMFMCDLIMGRFDEEVAGNRFNDISYSRN